MYSATTLPMDNGSSAPVVSLLCSSMSDQPIRDTGRDWISFTLTNRREHTRSIHCLLRQARTADARVNASGHVTTAWRIGYDDTNCFTVVEFVRRSVYGRFQKSKSAQ